MFPIKESNCLIRETELSTHHQVQRDRPSSSDCNVGAISWRDPNDQMQNTLTTDRTKDTNICPNFWVHGQNTRLIIRSQHVLNCNPPTHQHAIYRHIRTFKANDSHRGLSAWGSRYVCEYALELNISMMTKPSWEPPSYERWISIRKYISDQKQTLRQQRWNRSSRWWNSSWSYQSLYQSADQNSAQFAKWRRNSTNVYQESHGQEKSSQHEIMYAPSSDVNNVCEDTKEEWHQPHSLNHRVWLQGV